MEVDARVIKKLVAENDNLRLRIREKSVEKGSILERMAQKNIERMKARTDSERLFQVCVGLTLTLMLLGALAIFVLFEAGVIGMIGTVASQVLARGLV